MPGREVTDVERDPGEGLDLHRSARGQKPVGDPSLIEDLDCSSMQASRSRALQILGLAAFDDDNVDVGKRELCSEHHARRAATDDHHLGIRGRGL